MSLQAVCETDALRWAVFTGCWCVISKGEGCVALRAAQFCYTEFQVTLTHHGEKTGILTGGIQLNTSEGKPTEKLYGESRNQLDCVMLCAFYFSPCSFSFCITLHLDFIKVEKDDPVTSKGKCCDPNRWEHFYLLWLHQNMSNTIFSQYFLSSCWQVFCHPSTWYF